VKRLAKNSFCLMSLLVFVASLALWVRSYCGGDTILRSRAQMFPGLPRIARRSTLYIAEWNGGRLFVARYRVEARHRPIFLPGWQHQRGEMFLGILPMSPVKPAIDLNFSRARLSYEIKILPAGWNSALWLSIPLWLLFPAAIPPLVWLRRRRRRGFPITLASTTVPRDG
jgi:hypothetical protein